jgi:hypothetical protein
VPSGAYQRNGRLNTIAVTAKLVADVIVKIKKANDTARKLIAVSRPAVCRSPRRQESSMSVIESTNGQNGARAVSGYGHREFNSGVADLHLALRQRKESPAKAGQGFGLLGTCA